MYKEELQAHAARRAALNKRKREIKGAREPAARGFAAAAAGATTAATTAAAATAPKHNACVDTRRPVISTVTKSTTKLPSLLTPTRVALLYTYI